MYKLVTNDSLVHPLTALPYEDIVDIRGVKTKALCIPFGVEYDEVKTVREVVGDNVKMSTIRVYDGEELISVYKNYFNIAQIRTATHGEGDQEVDILEAVMTRVSDIPDQINELLNKIKAVEKEKEDLKSNFEEFKTKTTETISHTDELVRETSENINTFVSTSSEKITEIMNSNATMKESMDNVISTNREAVNTANNAKLTADHLSETVNSFTDSVNKNFETIAETEGQRSETLEKIENTVQELNAKVSGVNEEDMDIDQLKEHRILMSKQNLHNYLSEATVVSKCHGGEPAEYSITEEKQTQLMAMVMMASMNPEYQCSWNAKGEPCTYDWTVDELKMLAAEIEMVVRPLVSKQQHMENDIRSATTIEEVKEIDVTF